MLARPCNILRFFTDVHMKNCDMFLIFAKYIYRGYNLEPLRGGSNEYQQFMF